jgi:hypothetical protein
MRVMAREACTALAVDGAASMSAIADWSLDFWTWTKVTVIGP